MGLSSKRSPAAELVGRAVLCTPFGNQKRRRARSDAPYRKPAVGLLSTSYGTSRQPLRFARACCKPPQRAASAARGRRFAAALETRASRVEREGTRPFRARARRLSRRDRPIPPHRQFEFRDCDWLLSRANSIRASHQGKVLHLCTVRTSPSTSSRPHETCLIRGERLLVSMIVDSRHRPMKVNRTSIAARTGVTRPTKQTYAQW